MSGSSLDTYLFIYISNFINSNSVCHTKSELNLLQVQCEETKAEVLRGTWGIVYCTKLSWNVFVEITEESYFCCSPAGPALTG